MDEIDPETNSKIQKCFEGDVVEQKNDRISNLPDSILLHILSFMPIKEAIRTSLLSKRWKDLWIFLPNFDLNDGFGHLTFQKRHVELEYSFVMLVSKALFDRDTSCLRKFCLELNIDVSLDLFKDWISAAIENNVQVLDLNLCGRQPYLLPPSIFTSKSLCALKLSMLHTLKVPSCSPFGSLKCLNLKGVTFQDNESTQLLFSGFPILEELTLHDCGWQRITCVTFSIPSLRTFTFHFENIKHGLLECELQLYAVNLKSLKYTGFLAAKLLLCNQSSLVNASVGFYRKPELDYIETLRRAVELLGGIDRVKFLTLPSETLRFLFPTENLAVPLPIFYNLIHLEVGLNHREEPVPAGKELMYFLKRSPYLQSLDIPVGINSFKIEIMPNCLKSCLKTFSLSGFAASEFEVDFVKCLVNSATGLEKITIFAIWINIAFNFEKQDGLRQQFDKLLMTPEVVILRQMLDLLVHALQCRTQRCQYQNCCKVKGLFQHGTLCETRPSGGCILCKKMWYLLHLHAWACKESVCQMPHCRDLKEHLMNNEVANLNLIDLVEIEEGAAAVAENQDE